MHYQIAGRIQTSHRGGATVAHERRDGGSCEIFGWGWSELEPEVVASEEAERESDFPDWP